LILLCFLISCQRHATKTFKGRQLPYWEARLADLDVETRAEAVRAVALLFDGNKRIIDRFVDLATDADSSVSSAAMSAIQSLWTDLEAEIVREAGCAEGRKAIAVCMVLA